MAPAIFFTFLFSTLLHTFFNEAWKVFYGLAHAIMALVFSSGFCPLLRCTPSQASTSCLFSMMSTFLDSQGQGLSADHRQTWIPLPSPFLSDEPVSNTSLSPWIGKLCIESCGFLVNDCGSICCYEHMRDLI